MPDYVDKIKKGAEELPIHGKDTRLPDATAADVGKVLGVDAEGNLVLKEVSGNVDYQELDLTYSVIGHAATLKDIVEALSLTDTEGYFEIKYSFQGGGWIDDTMKLWLKLSTTSSAQGTVYTIQIVKGVLGENALGADPTTARYNDVVYKTLSELEALSLQSFVVNARQTILGKIDNVSEAIASYYSETKAYNVGDYVLQRPSNNTVYFKLYKCTTAIPSPGEAWNASHWAAVTILEEIPEAGTKLYRHEVTFGSNTDKIVVISRSNIQIASVGDCFNPYLGINTFVLTYGSNRMGIITGFAIESGPTTTYTISYKDFGSNTEGTIVATSSDTVSDTVTEL